jgi:hypothetical protein
MERLDVTKNRILDYRAKHASLRTVSGVRLISRQMGEEQENKKLNQMQLW